MDPVLVKDILSRPNEFQKPRKDYMAHVLVGGLFTTEGNIWAKHKKIINPAFHIEKIKVHLYTLHTHALHTPTHKLVMTIYADFLVFHFYINMERTWYHQS